MSDTRDKLAFWFHDRECPDRCDPLVMGAFFRMADALLASDVLRDMLAEAEARGRAEVAAGRAVAATHHDPLAPGTPVLAWPGSREASPLVTRTRSEVWTLPAGDRVVMVEGHAGGIALTHVDVLPTAALADRGAGSLAHSLLPDLVTLNRGDGLCACGSLALSTTASERHDRGLHGVDDCIAWSPDRGRADHLERDGGA